MEDFTLTQVARQALDSGILSEATRLRQALFETEHSGSGGPFSVTPDGKDIIRLQGTEVVDQLERSYQEAGAEETLIITRSNKAANLYNQGVRARILWKEDQVSSGDRLMISKNNYYWTQEYEQLDFLANGDLMGDSTAA